MDRRKLLIILNKIKSITTPPIDPPSYGPELIQNGDFTEGGTGGNWWSTYGDGAISIGQARIYSSDGSDAALYQSNIMEVGKQYKVEFDVLATDGQILTDSNYTIQWDTATTGSKVQTITANDARIYFRRRANAPQDCTITNISVKEVT